MNIQSQLEAILFVASKPLSYKALANATGVNLQDIELALRLLTEKFNTPESGIHILESEGTVQMTTNPEEAEVIEKFVEKEIKSELTRAQLETLTVIAYRGPLTRPEIEQIRGVNCALILRNLMMRSLVEENAGVDDLVPSYVLSIDALRVLGLSKVQDLPEYEALHSHAYLEQALESGIHDI